MSKRRVLMGLALLALAAVGLRFSTAVVAARETLPPRSTNRQIIRAVFHPPYKMVAPHHSSASVFEIFFSPTACAGLENLCDGTETKATANPNCNSGDYCPDCVSGPCVIYKCKPTGNMNHLCDFFQSSNPNCAGCEDDRDVVANTYTNQMNDLI